MTNRLATMRLLSVWLLVPYLLLSWGKIIGYALVNMMKNAPLPTTYLPDAVQIHMPRLQTFVPFILMGKKNRLHIG